MSGQDDSRAGGEGTDRRTFLGQTAATATVAWFWFEGLGNPLRRGRVEPTRPGAPRQTFSEVEWDTLDAALRRILPSAEGSPGAAEVNAIGYLDAVLQDKEVEPDQVARVRAGVRRLMDFAEAEAGGPFARLPPETQDAGIRLFEQPWAQQMWLRNVISFALEAFLGDPIHGGNVGEAGWEWAGVEPPPFRPTAPWRARGDGPPGAPR
jgi:hypothetical protein